jgi:hypothetical protein
MENPPKNGKSTSSSPLTHLENPPLGLREGKIETGNHQFSHQEKRAFRFRFSLKPIHGDMKWDSIINILHVW